MNIYKIVTLSVILLTFSTVVFANAGAPPATPIDGGLSLLLAAGAAFGVKKIRDSRK